LSERRTVSFSQWSSLARYFIHGLAFSGLISLALIIWLFIGFSLVVVMPFLTIVGIVIALIVSFALLLVMLGGLNATLTESIWHVPIDQSWSHVVVHSILLMLMLILVGVPSAAISFLVPSWVTSVLLFIVYGFVDGFVAKEVAFIWKTTERLDEGFRGLLTVLKYPGLIAMFAADAVIVMPIFIISLTTKLWWVGTIIFFFLQSPIIYLAVADIMNERSKTMLPNDGWWTPGKPAKFDAKIPGQAIATERVTKLSIVSRVFFHGLIFSVLGILLVLLGWMLRIFFFIGFWTSSADFAAVFAVTVGFVIVLVMALIIDWFVVGGINTMLTEFIWHAETKHDWKRLLIHGLALNVTFGIASIPILIISLYPITLPIELTLFIAYCFIYGAIARRIAFTWKTGEKQPDHPEIPKHERYQNLINI